MFTWTGNNEHSLNLAVTIKSVSLKELMATSYAGKSVGEFSEASKLGNDTIPMAS